MNVATVKHAAGKEHIFGRFESDGSALACNICKPVEYKATALLLHGYMNHSAQLKHLTAFLVERNFAAAVFDLPGHGFSGGGRGTVDDFTQYGSALTDFLATVENYCRGPYHFVGFSLGAAVGMEYLLGKESGFDKIILAAPLIRYRLWEQSKTAIKLCGTFAEGLPAILHDRSADGQYRRNLKTDPLQIRKIPFKWLAALHRWNEKIESLPACTAAVKIIQGTADKTVDWRYNLEFLRKKFPNAEIKTIENAGHELFNQPCHCRVKCIKIVADYLESNSNDCF